MSVGPSGDLRADPWRHRNYQHETAGAIARDPLHLAQTGHRVTEISEYTGLKTTPAAHSCFDLSQLRLIIIYLK